MQEYRITKAFLHKATLQIDPKKFLYLKELKILCCGDG